MAPDSKSVRRPRPSEIATDIKRNFIPQIKSKYAKLFPPYSILYPQPLQQLRIHRRMISTIPPEFRVEQGDPVMRALYYAAMDSQENQRVRIRIPFICCANERRPGGDWETGSRTYEEKLCRRSNLAAILSSPWPEMGEEANYPIPPTGGILSDSVAICRASDDTYERLDALYDMPVVSVHPTRWPKLKENGCKYSFEEERQLIRDKMRGALHICLHNGYDRVVIGDFGLGNAYRNPPLEMAEMWRDIFLFDPCIRGQFNYVVFVFEDPCQCTSKLIVDDMIMKEKKGSSSKSSCKISSLTAAAVSQRHITDINIFQRVFQDAEIVRVLSLKDPRYDLHMCDTGYVESYLHPCPGVG